MSAILKIAAKMVAILKNKVDEDAPLIAKILNAKNGVGIRCRLGVKDAQTDRQTDTQDDRKSPPLTPNGPFTSLKAVWE